MGGCFPMGWLGSVKLRRDQSQESDAVVFLEQASIYRPFPVNGVMQWVEKLLHLTSETMFVQGRRGTAVNPTLRSSLPPTPFPNHDLSNNANHTAFKACERTKIP